MFPFLHFSCRPVCVWKHTCKTRNALSETHQGSCLASRLPWVNQSKMIHFQQTIPAFYHQIKMPINPFNELVSKSRQRHHSCTLISAYMGYMYITYDGSNVICTFYEFISADQIFKWGKYTNKIICSTHFCNHCILKGVNHQYGIVGTLLSVTSWKCVERTTRQHNLYGCRDHTHMGKP